VAEPLPNHWEVSGDTRPLHVFEEVLSGLGYRDYEGANLRLTQGSESKTLHMIVGVSRMIEMPRPNPLSQVSNLSVCSEEYRRKAPNPSISMFTANAVHQAQRLP
jgi:hypothetical protein